MDGRATAESDERRAKGSLGCEKEEGLVRRIHHLVIEGLRSAGGVSDREPTAD
jgi:hypothetical protein